jgi:hypothetical protein
MVGGKPRVYDLVHPVDHDLLEKVGYVLYLLFGTLRDQLIVAGDRGLGVEGTGRPRRSAAASRSPRTNGWK